MSIRFLRGFQVAKHTQGIRFSSSSEKSQSRLYQIARPNQVIATEIFVTFIESPGYRQARDYSAEEIFGFVRPHHRNTGTIEIALPRRLIQLLQWLLPFLPMPHVVIAHVLIGFQQAGTRLLACYCPHSAEAKRKNEFAARCSEINFSRKRDIAVFCARVLPGHLIMLREILPAIRSASESHRHFFPRH